MRIVPGIFHKTRAWIRNVRVRDQLQAFDSVETFLLFIGHPRSGHSLLGSLIDAHPDAVISHEVDALKYLREGESKTSIFNRLLRNSIEVKQSARKDKLAGYTCIVPGQWQGRARILRLIGDKKAV